MGIGIAQLKRIYTDLSGFRLGQIVGPPEGLLGWFKFVRYNDGDGIRGIRGMLAEYAKSNPDTDPPGANDVNGAGEPGFDTVTVDTSGASNLSAGILVGDSPLGFSNGGVYQNDQYGFIQLCGRPIVDLWMSPVVHPGGAVVQDEILVPNGSSDGLMNGMAITSATHHHHQSVGYALANGELLINDQSLVTFPAGLTGTDRYSVGGTVIVSGTEASGTAVINEIFSSYSGATETQWGMRITGTNMVIATSDNTTFTGSGGAQAVSLLNIAERIKAVNVRLTLPLS